jgi:hypothetical protein
MSFKLYESFKKLIEAGQAVDLSTPDTTWTGTALNSQAQMAALNNAAPISGLSTTNVASGSTTSPVTSGYPIGLLVSVASHGNTAMGGLGGGAFGGAQMGSGHNLFVKTGERKMGTGSFMDMLKDLENLSPERVRLHADMMKGMADSEAAISSEGATLKLWHANRVMASWEATVYGDQEGHRVLCNSLTWQNQGGVSVKGFSLTVDVPPLITGHKSPEWDWDVEIAPQDTLTIVFDDGVALAVR